MDKIFKTRDELKKEFENSGLDEEIIDIDFSINGNEEEKITFFDNIEKDVFAIYFEQINYYKLITPDEEVKLFKSLRDTEKERKHLESIDLDTLSANEVKYIKNRIKNNRT